MGDPRPPSNKVYIGDYLTKHLTAEPITKLRQSKKVIIGAIVFLAAILLLVWGIPKVSFMLSDEYVSQGRQREAVAELEDAFLSAGFTVSDVDSSRDIDLIGGFETTLMLGTSTERYSVHAYQFSSSELASSAIGNISADGRTYSGSFGYESFQKRTLDAASPHWYRTGNTLIWLDCSDEAVLDALSALFGEPVKG